MSAEAATMAWPQPAFIAIRPPFTAEEMADARRLARTGVWAIWHKNPLAPQPIFRGTVDIRPQADAACTSPDDYIWLVPHNNPMSAATTDDPMPYLCYPRRDRELNEEHARLFAGIETTESLITEAIATLEVVNGMLQTSLDD